MTSRLLIVDDEPRMCSLLAAILQCDEYQIDIAHSGTEALAMTENKAYDLVVTDQLMPGMTGLELLARLQGSDSSQKAILVTGSQGGSTEHALREGLVCDIITKPFANDAVKDAVRRALHPKSPPSPSAL